MAAERLAAIDIGTVTTRLLVADVGDGTVAEVARRQRITHLGEGWTATGELSDAAIERVASAIGAFVAEARSLGATRIAAVATSAARDAANGEALLAACESAGVRPEIIGGAREAALSFAGATYGLTGEDLLVVDVGGGSTELVLGNVTAGDDGARETEIVSARSVDVGSRRVTELYLHADPPRESELAPAWEWVAGELRPYFNGLRVKPRTMIAVAGTATSLAAIDLELEPYDPERVHGYVLGGHRLFEIREELAAMTLARRERVRGLEPDRAGVIVGGALVLEAVLALAGLDSTVVSEHDILYGIALDLHASGM